MSLQCCCFGHIETTPVPVIIQKVADLSATRVDNKEQGKYLWLQEILKNQVKSASSKDSRDFHSEV